MWHKLIIVSMLLSSFMWAQGGLFFSEYAEGSSSNKYLEIYNGSNDTIDLGDYSISSCSNGCDTTNATTSVVGFDYPDNVAFEEGTLLLPGEMHIVINPNADQAILSRGDTEFLYLSNGDDVFALTEVGATTFGYTIVDIIGTMGADPGSGWDVAGVTDATKDHTLVRKSTVVGGNADWTESAGTDATDSEWIVLGKDFWGNLGVHNETLSLFFSEYSEGSFGNNKYVEIYNPTLGDADLSTIQVWGSNNGNGWDVDRYHQLSGTLASGDVYVLAADAADADILAETDSAFAYESAFHFNGDDAVALVSIVGTDTTILDMIGDPDLDPGSGWKAAGVDDATKDHTLIRKSNVVKGNSDWYASADTTTGANSEWIVTEKDVRSFLGSHGPFSATVTFVANTAMVQGVVDTNDVSAGIGQTGVDLRGPVQQYTGNGGFWTPQKDFLESLGGDYWTVNVTFPDYAMGPGLEYKYGFNVLNLDGTITSSWEGASNRPLNVPYMDDTLAVDYVGNGDTPFTDDPDTLDVYFRVNMATNTDFNPATQNVHIAGSLEGWSHTIVMEQEASSSYYNYHFKLAPVDSAPVTVEWKYTLGDWSGTHESIDNRTAIVNQDTTIQWVYYNNVFPKPFAASDTLSTLTMTVDVSNAIANNGFELGDTLIVKYGYGGSQTSVAVDTLLGTLGNLYAVELSDFGFDSEVGLYYQYYRIKGGIEYREIFYNFEYDGTDNAVAERRYNALTGATNGGTFTISDTEDSRTVLNRMPLFRNAEKLGQAVTVTYTVDIRPAYYQVLIGGDTLDDIQGTFDVEVADSVFAWGVSINGPASGGWTTWGGTLAGTDSLTMVDDGTNGDVVAGDSIYSVQFTYTTDDVVGQEFKFGIGGGDNEGGYGNNHIENIDVDNPVVASQFGSIDPLFYDVWNYDAGERLSIEELEAALPSRFSLSDNYPNPFNPTTTINFTIPQGADVRLNIYNLLGELVATVHNEYAKPGTYQATWNGRDMNGQTAPSGIYFYELDAGAYFHQVKKMTLLK